MLHIAIMLVFCIIGLVMMPLVAMMLYPIYKKYGNEKRSLKEFLRYVFN